MRQVKPLKYGSLPGLSEKLLSEHFNLYKGYVNKINEIDQKIALANKGEANPTFSSIRELKLEQTFAANAVRLHEGYFANLAGDGKPSGDAMNFLNEDFGSIDSWMNDIRAAGISARGWVVCCYDLEDNKVRNYSLDAHNIGDVFNCITLIIMDVYEHAYYLDYGTNRKEYIETFFNNLNWSYANSQIQKFDLINLRTQLKAA